MADGLKIVVGADVKGAEDALASLIPPLERVGDEAAKTGAKLGGLDKPLTTATAQSKRFASAMLTLPRGVGQANSSLVSFSRILQDAPFGFIAIQNNITELIPTFQRLKQETGSTGAAFKALFSAIGGAGGFGLAISAITSALTFFALSNRGAKKETEDHKAAIDVAAEAQKKYQQAIDAAAGSIINQAKDIKNLRDLLLSTDSATQKLTESTINLGVARFIFDSKNEALQKILTAEIEKQLILRKQSVGVAGQEESSYDAQLAFLKQQRDALKRAGQGTVNLDKDIRRIEELNQVIGNSGGAVNTLNEMADGLQGLFKGFLDGKAKGGPKDDLIERAKELAKELEKIGFIQPQFKFFDTLAEQTEKAKKVFADFNSGNLKINPKFFDVDLTAQFPTPESVRPEINDFLQGVQKGIVDAGPVTIPAGLTEDQQQVARVISEFNEKFTRAGIKFTIPVKLDLSGTGSNANAVLQEEFNKQIKLKALQDRLQAIVNGFAGDLFVGLGQAIGDAIGGSSSIFEALFKTIAAGMKQFGEALIALGTAKLALDKLFKGPQGGILAIGAGVALIALSAAVSNFTGPKFAKGGLVTGPTLGLVGEGRGTSSSNPEVIAPLDKLKGMLGDLGGGRQTVVVMGKIRGKDLALSGARTSKSQSRLGAA
jgi:hypothetical protein